MAERGMAQGLRNLMEARSVAIVGASEKPGSSAGFVVKNLMAGGYDGAIYPVHPTRASVFELAAFPSLAALPALPDAVVFGIAAAAVPAELEDAGGRGIRAAIVLASGFAETGPSGLSLQAQIQDIAKRYDMAVCGPNCLGLFNPATGLSLYSSRIAPTRPGCVAIVSHSGALCIALAHCGRFGVSTAISAGNAAITDMDDYLFYLADDPNTRVAALVLERIGNPARFSAAVRAMHAAGKRVVVLHVGRSLAGASASAAHTGSINGPGQAYDVFFETLGVVAVRTLDTMIEVVSLLSRQEAAGSDKGVVLMGVSGGAMAYVSDVADMVGLKLSPLSGHSLAALKTILPAYATPQNPLDLTGIVFSRPDIYGLVLDVLDADPEVGAVVAVQDIPAGLDDGGVDEYGGIVSALADNASGMNKALVLLTNIGSGLHSQIGAELLKSSLPVVHGTMEGLTAIKALTEPFPARQVSAPDDKTETQPAWAARFSKSTPLSEREAKLFLHDHGVTMPFERFVRTREEAADAAQEIAAPVAVKIVSADLPHKSEYGGVKLDVRGPLAAAEAFDEVVALVSASAANARIEGALVGEMVTQGLEVLVGITSHPIFGHTLSVGLGGVMVELIAESALAILPVQRPGIERLIDQTRLAPLLAGFRGGESGDRDALVETILAITKIATAYRDDIVSLEINPIVVLPVGKGVRIIDILIETSDRHRDIGPASA